nr:MAG TPA: hypothetical protein [Caudoviricetes sp.]
MLLAHGIKLAPVNRIVGAHIGRLIQGSNGDDGLLFSSGHRNTAMLRNGFHYDFFHDLSLLFLLGSFIPTHRDNVGVASLVFNAVNSDRNRAIRHPARIVLALSKQRAVRVIDLGIVHLASIFIFRIATTSSQHQCSSQYSCRDKSSESHLSHLLIRHHCQRQNLLPSTSKQQIHRHFDQFSKPRSIHVRCR